MKYSKRQLKGLIASVDAWVKKYEGKSNVYGISGCPLCALYNQHTADDPRSCKGCPIKNNTGFRFCKGTPYDSVLFWIESTKSDKLKQLRYLISLLPKAEQKRYSKFKAVK